MHEREGFFFIKGKMEKLRELAESQNSVRRKGVWNAVAGNGGETSRNKQNDVISRTTFERLAINFFSAKRYHQERSMRWRNLLLRRKKYLIPH